MKTNKKPFGNPNAKGDITGVFEILIPNEMWGKIEKAQRKHVKFTYSWIVRYSLFRLLKQKKFWRKFKFVKLKAEDKTVSKNRKACHRHSLCLYGDDHIRLKILAAELGIPISVLVRVALQWYLQEFEADTIPDFAEAERESRKFAGISFEKLKKYGTKFVKDLQVDREQENYHSAWTVSKTVVFDERDFW